MMDIYKTLYDIAAEVGWDWKLGPEIDNPDQLYNEGMLYKAYVDRKKISGAYGSDLKEMCFSISIKGFLFLCKNYPGAVIDDMKYTMFLSIFNNGELYSDVLNSEKFYKNSRII